MSLEQRLTAAARHVADGLVPPEVDLGAVRARARSNRRRTAGLAVAASVAVAVAAGALTVGGRPTGLPDPVPATSTSPSPVPSRPPARAFSPESMTPQVVVGTSGAQLDLVGVSPTDTDVRMSAWSIADYRGMALTTDGYRTTTYAAFPDGATQVIGVPGDGVFLLSDGNDHEWLVGVDGRVRPVTRVSSAFSPADPRQWFRCVYGSWRSRWCSLDVATATAHLSTARWGGSAVRPGLGVQPWGAHPEPRSAYSTGRLEAWWYTAAGRQVRTLAQARDGDYVLDTPPGQMAFWAPGSAPDTVDLHTSRDGGATWEVQTRGVPAATGPGRRVFRTPGGALLTCTSGAGLVVSRAEAGGGPFRTVFEAAAFGPDPCAGLLTQGGSLSVNAGDVAAVSTDDGRSWTTIDTWREGEGS